MRYMMYLGLAVAVTLPAHAQKDAHKKRPDPVLILAQFDTNGDQQISHSEMMARANARFKQMDKNGDGRVQLDELPQKVQRSHAREAGGPRDDRDNVTDNDTVRGMPRLKFIARLDRDGDEQLSLDEFARPAIHRFKRMDINGDGTVTKAELEALKDQPHRGKGRRWNGKK